MKSLISLLFSAALCLGQTSAPTPQSPPAEQENARRARTLIDQAIQALGGQAYLSIQDISQEGRAYSFYHGESNSVGVPYWSFYRFPDKSRVELTKQRDIVYVFNGGKGYEITFKGTAPADPKDLAKQVRRQHFALDVLLRQWLNEPGVALFYEGTAVAEQKQADQISIMNARNEGVTLYLDVTTHLPIKKSVTWRDPTDKERNIEEDVYDAYRPVQGIMTPFSITHFYNGDMADQRFLNVVSYNKGLSDSLFTASVTYDPKKLAPRR